MTEISAHVSVITPTIRRPELKTRCIPSVVAQELAAEHVIVDDPQRIGAGASRCRGLALAHGDLIAYLDDDDAYRPHHLAALATALDANPGAGWAYAPMLVHLGEGHTAVWRSPPATPMFMHRATLPAPWGNGPEAEEAPIFAAWDAAGAKGIAVASIGVDVYPTPGRIRALMLYVATGRLAVACAPGCDCAGEWLAAWLREVTPALIAEVVRAQGG